MNDKERIKFLSMLAKGMRTQIEYLEHLVDSVVADRDLGAELHFDEIYLMRNKGYSVHTSERLH